MDNGTTAEVVGQFDKIAALPETWGHNEQYHGFLLRRLPETPGLVLDVGCGTGGFSRLLAERSAKVIGIDVSPNMIREAAKRTQAKNVEYACVPADAFLAGVREAYDAITTIAVLHHLDTDSFLSSARDALKPGGVLAILDLYEPKSLWEFFLSAFAVPANLVLRVLKRGTLATTKAEKDAWADHSRHDRYDTMRTIRNRAARLLGCADIKRHLLWRYSLVYRKPL